MADDERSWYGLIMETASLLQQDAKEQASKKAQDAFEIINSIKVPADKFQGLISLYDLVKNHYDAHLVSNNPSYPSDPLLALAMRIAQQLTVLSSEVPVGRMDDYNRDNIGRTLARLGYDCIRAGDMDTAVSLFEGAIRISCQMSAYDITQLAETLRQRERLLIAEQFLDMAYCRCDKSSAEAMRALLNLALCNVYLKNTVKAEQYFERLSLLKDRTPNCPREFEHAKAMYAQAQQAIVPTPKIIEVRVGDRMVKRKAPQITPPGFSMESPYE